MWGGDVAQKEWKWNVVFGSKKLLFEDLKSFHGVGPLYLIMMTLDPITLESGSQQPCPAI